MIRKLSHTEIDRQKWNAIIEQSAYSSLYAKSQFLDVVCPNWEALVLDDYDAVFPIPIKKRLGISYVVQPILSQQYTIYTNRTISKEEKNEFIEIFKRYKFVRISLSEPLLEPTKEKSNYVLNLNKSYQDLRNNFSRNTIRNIVKAQKNNIFCEQLFDRQQTVDTFLAHDIKGHYKQHTQQIIKLLQSIDWEAYSITNGIHRYATAIFLKTGNRLYYLFPASSDEGKEKSAMFLLIDSVIQKYAGTNLIIDFEGSDLEGVKRFYTGWGAENNPYYFVKRIRIND
ncbi:MAG: DUF1494 domain-containing protein [Bacteroidales bacterium]|nr:DUF1494 domain-containing protein [Bacteroidales bacterium]